jgi:hypothetical protein
VAGVYVCVQTQNDLRIALQRLPLIESLKVRRVYHMTDIALYSCAAMKKLSRVDLTECKHLEVTVPLLRALNPNGLHTLACRAVGFTEDGFEALSTLRQLRSLDISRCIGPSFGDYGPVLSQLSNLTELDISFCDLVSRRPQAVIPPPPPPPRAVDGSLGACRWRSIE